MSAEHSSGALLNMFTNLHSVQLDDANGFLVAPSANLCESEFDVACPTSALCIEPCEKASRHHHALSNSDVACPTSASCNDLSEQALCPTHAHVDSVVASASAGGYVCSFDTPSSCLRAEKSCEGETVLGGRACCPPLVEGVIPAVSSAMCDVQPSALNSPDWIQDGGGSMSHADRRNP